MSRTITRVALDASVSAPYRARRVVAALIDRGPAIKSIDAALLTSELVTASAMDGAEVAITIRSSAASVRIEVGTVESSPVDELVERLLTRLSDRWEAGPPPWFEIDLVRRPRRQDVTEDELWRMLADDPAARDEIFARYESLAAAIARRFRQSGERSDLNQVAFMALVGAIDRFDPSRGIKFSTFASKTVSGELKKYLRDSAWAIKVPRGLKETVLRVTREKNRLGQQLGRAPTSAELATATGLTEEEVVEATGAGQAFGAASLDAPVAADSTTAVIDTLANEDDVLVDAESWWMIQPIIKELPERDQQVLHLRFFEDMSQSEIADILNVSQMQVSRILSGIFDHIKSEVG